MKREEIYKLIDEERNYQDNKWNCNTTTSCGQHSITEFLVFIRDYVEEALHVQSRNNEKIANEFTTHSMRKIATLAVACMEQNGGLSRTIENK